jgi:hypothetical protein
MVKTPIVNVYMVSIYWQSSQSPSSDPDFATPIWVIFSIKIAIW